ncbi:MAG TPA: cytidylate kinase-like family protein [Terracidiphilus sp.]|jgi:cytidylate kinase|nr:cytidylate kinase-like family protein [Terracidiphilus sp.]HUX28552.1 cytidylate kinase-like family protein [Terracidiphilus sp.]
MSRYREEKVNYRVLTVNREFGSGGGRIAQTIAGWLGWKLLDRNIIDAIAYAAQVDAKVVRHYDEHVDSWLRRLNQQAMRGAALAAGLELGENAVFDADAMVKISQKVIERAWTDGNCVIVGRGSQCVLQNKPDVFHAFVYAPLRDRILRLRKRLEKGVDVDERIRIVDGERAKYLQEYFGESWCNLHLYNLLISSREDEDATARVILQAMNGDVETESGE